MSSQFNNVPIAVNQRSRQNLGNRFSGSHDFGRMDVVYVNSDIVPGDSIYLNINGFLRGAPMPAPTYGAIDVDVRVFFVPHRIATSRPSEVVEGSFSWDNFITGVSSTAHPYCSFWQLFNTFDPQNHSYPLEEGLKDIRRLFSQLGFPAFLYNATSWLDVSPSDNQRSNLWKLHAYQRVWWDWYRDSQLIDEQNIRNYIPLLTAGYQSDDTVTKLCYPREACFRKDYYTTAKKFPQTYAQTAVANVANTSGTDTYGINAVNYNPKNVFKSGSSTQLAAMRSTSNSSTTAFMPVQWLRAANSLQTYLERNNLAGTRLMERFLARFGISPTPVALDMSEYLGGSRNTIRVGDVTANNEEFGASFTPNNAFNTANVNGSSVGTIQGQLGGKCASKCSSGNISYHAKEFGTLIAIQTIVPHISYIQGYSVENTRGTDNDKFGYFTPEMENNGYEPIYNREIAFTGNQTNDNAIFGFKEKYKDYKFKNDIVSGDLVLSETSSGMDSWHLARIFNLNEPPALNTAFTAITAGARHGLDRVFSIQGDPGQLDHFTSDINCECKIERNMTDNSLPTLEPENSNKTVKVQNGGVRM